MKLKYCLTATAFLALGIESVPNSRPVCIIGAGPSGLIAAAKLESKGQSVVLFEKQNKVGGKCQAVYENDQFHPLGALLYSNATYTETLKIIALTGVTSVPFASKERWLYNTTSGVTAPAPPMSVEFATLVGEEFARYTLYWTTIFAPYSALRYKNGVPADFTVTTSEWLAANNFQALPVIFIQAMVAFGYGDLRETPILYMLQYLTPDLVAFFIGLHPGYLIDFHKVFVRFAKVSIKGPIHLGTQVTKIDRGGNHPVIYYHDDTQEIKKKDCSSLILAFPPTISALERANLIISLEERTIFSPVGLTDYFSGAVRLITPPELSFGALSSAPDVPTEAFGAPVSFLKLFATSNIASTWSWGRYRGGTTYQQAKELLKETLSRLNKDPRYPSAVAKQVTDQDVLGFRKTDYFPHFDSQQLKNGWYEKFNQLQGKKRTFYVSGLNGVETVEFALRAGIDIVESFF